MQFEKVKKEKKRKKDLWEADDDSLLMRSRPLWEEEIRRDFESAIWNDWVRDRKVDKLELNVGQELKHNQEKS